MKEENIIYGNEHDKRIGKIKDAILNMLESVSRIENFTATFPNRALTRSQMVRIAKELEGNEVDIAELDYEITEYLIRIE